MCLFFSPLWCDFHTQLFYITHIITWLTYTSPQHSRINLLTEVGSAGPQWEFPSLTRHATEEISCTWYSQLQVELILQQGKKKKAYLQYNIVHTNTSSWRALWSLIWSLLLMFIDQATVGVTTTVRTSLSLLHFATSWDKCHIVMRLISGALWNHINTKRNLILNRGHVGTTVPITSNQWSTSSFTLRLHFKNMPCLHNHCNSSWTFFTYLNLHLPFSVAVPCLVSKGVYSRTCQFLSTHQWLLNSNHSPLGSSSHSYPSL